MSFYHRRKGVQAAGQQCAAGAAAAPGRARWHKHPRPQPPSARRDCFSPFPCQFCIEQAAHGGQPHLFGCERRPAAPSRLRACAMAGICCEMTLRLVLSWGLRHFLNLYLRRAMDPACARRWAHASRRPFIASQQRARVQVDFAPRAPLAQPTLCKPLFPAWNGF